MQHSFTWAGNFETVTRWYPFAIGRLKQMRQLKIASDTSVPAPGVRVRVNALSAHIFIEATGGSLFIIEGETDKGGDFVSRYTTSLIETIAGEGDEKDTFNLIFYGFLQSKVIEEKQLEIISSQVKDNYFEDKSPVNLFSSRKQLGKDKRIELNNNRYYNQSLYEYSEVQQGYGLYDSDLLITRYDKELNVIEAVVFKHTDTITEHHESKDVVVPGVYQSFDFSFKAITPDQIAIGNHLSNTPAFYSWMDRNINRLNNPDPVRHYYMSCASVYKLDGLTMTRAVSFDMANYYDFKIVEPEEIKDAPYDFYNYFYAYYFVVDAGGTHQIGDDPRVTNLVNFYNQYGFTDTPDNGYSEINKFIEIYNGDSDVMFSFFKDNLSTRELDIFVTTVSIDLDKEVVKRYHLFELYKTYDAKGFLASIDFDTRVDSVFNDETGIVIGGQLTGYMEHAIKGGKLFYITAITQGVFDGAQLSPFDFGDYKFTGTNDQGISEQITGGEIRPFISEPIRNRLEVINENLTSQYDGNTTYGNFHDLSSGIVYSDKNYLRSNNSLGTIVTMDNDLNIVEARAVYSNELESPDMKVKIVYSEVASIINTAENIISIHRSGRYELTPLATEFSAICKWSRDLKEFDYIIIGQPDNYYLMASVLFGDYIYAVGMRSIDGKLHPVLIKLTLELTIEQCVTYVIPNQGFLNIGMFGFFSSIYFDDNSTKIMLSGYGVDGDKTAGAMVASIDPDDLLKIVMRGTGGGNGFSQFDNVNVHEDEVILAGMDNDVSTGIGATVAKFSSEYLGATGKVSSLDELYLRAIKVEAVNSTPAVSKEGLGSLYATDRVKRIVKEEFYEAQALDLNSIGGNF